MFDILEEKFALLKMMQPYPLKMQARLVISASVIVNFSRQFDGERAFYDCEETQEHNDTGEFELEDRTRRDDDVDVSQDDLRMVIVESGLARGLKELFLQRTACRGRDVPRLSRVIGAQLRIHQSHALDDHVVVGMVVLLAATAAATSVFHEVHFRSEC